MINLQQYTKEFKYNLSLSFPVILGLLGHTIVQLVDNIMVGQLGTNQQNAEIKARERKQNLQEY